MSAEREIPLFLLNECAAAAPWALRYGKFSRIEPGARPLHGTFRPAVGRGRSGRRDHGIAYFLASNAWDFQRKGEPIASNGSHRFYAEVLYSYGETRPPSSRLRRKPIIMNKLLRLLWVFLRAGSRPPCSPWGPCLTPFVVLPGDLDVFLHMNNGVYFSIMDLARYDMLIRSGLLKSVRKAKLSPIVAAETIRFRRPLKLFQRYWVETRIIGWDDKAFLMEQRFLRRSRKDRKPDAVVAEAIVRARFILERNAIGSADFLEVLGHADEASPELPEWVSQWNARQSQMRAAERTADAVS